MRRLLPSVIAMSLLSSACSGSDDSSEAQNTAADGTIADPTVSTASDELPGGDEIELLVERNYLVDGKLFSPQAATDDPERDAALCQYLFGTPAEVAAVAALDSDAELADGSGFAVMGGGGTGYRCGYAVDATMMLELTLWSFEIERDFDAVTVSDPGGWFALAGYPEGAPVDAPDDELLEEWLDAAIDRAS